MDATRGKQFTSRQADVEVMVARMLRVGSVIAASLIAVGLLTLLLGAAESTGAHLVTAGLIALVLTPVLRVVVAFIVYLRERDYIFAAISAIVLVALATGVLLGQVH